MFSFCCFFSPYPSSQFFQYLKAFLDRDVELDVCKCLFLRNHFRTDDGRLLMKSVEFLLEYTGSFITVYRCSLGQEKEIQERLAAYLMDLAHLYSDILPSASGKIMAKALRQDPKGIFSMPFLKSAVKFCLGFIGKDLKR